MNFSEEQQRERWFVAMQADLLSSEESGMEADEEVIVVKTLPWRNDQVTSLMRRLDDKIKVDRSPQANRQAKKRIYGAKTSTRSQPTICENMPAWLFKRAQ